MITVAIIGCGDIAFAYDDNGPGSKGALSHAGAIRAAGGFDVVACMDPDGDARARAKAAFPGVSCFSDLDAMRMAGIRSDLVLVTSPTRFHGAAIDYALDQGARAIFCEKPVSDDGATSRALVTRVAAEKRVMGVNYLRLWDPSMRQLATDIAAGRYGTLQSAAGVFVKGITHNGPHMIALLSDLLGQVCLDEAATRALPDTGEAGLVAILRSPEGRPVSLTRLDHQFYNAFELELCFEKALIRLEDGARRIVHRYPVPHPEYPAFAYPEDRKQQDGDQALALTAAWENWRACLNDDAPLVRDAAWALAQEEICHRIVALRGRD